MKILAPGFYARQNLKTPVKIAFLTVLFAQTLAVILMFQIGHAGLTLSTSLGACFNATLLYVAMRRAAHFPAAAGLVALSAAPGNRARRARHGAVVRAGRRRVLDRTPDYGRRSVVCRG